MSASTQQCHLSRRYIALLRAQKKRSFSSAAVFSLSPCSLKRFIGLAQSPSAQLHAWCFATLRYVRLRLMNGGFSIARQSSSKGFSTTRRSRRSLPSLALSSKGYISLLPLAFFSAVRHHSSSSGTPASEGSEREFKHMEYFGATPIQAPSTSFGASSPFPFDPKEQLNRVRSVCPTAAILVDTDSSVRVSLSYCTATVYNTVQAHLRALLVEQVLAAQLADDFGSGLSDAAAEALATTTLGVHQALHQIRLVAFSTMKPRLQHSSWCSLWAAYRRHLLSLTDRVSAISDGRVAIDEESKGEVSESEVSKLRTEAAKLQLGEVEPLFGTATTGTFFSVTPPQPQQQDVNEVKQWGSPTAGKSNVADSADSLPLEIDNRLSSSSNVSGLLKPTNTANVSSSSSAAGSSSTAAHSVWECFRVDGFMPTHVQLQAAVRHLLQTRRPPAPELQLTGERGLNHSTGALALSARPLCVLALVVPDLLVEVHEEYLNELERKRTEALSRNGGACGRSVQLMLFNSSRLVRVLHAI